MNDVQRKIKSITLVRELSKRLETGKLPMVVIQDGTYRIKGLTKCAYRSTQTQQDFCRACAGFILRGVGYEICATQRIGEIELLEDIK